MERYELMWKYFCSSVIGILLTSFLSLSGATPAYSVTNGQYACGTSGTFEVSSNTIVGASSSPACAGAVTIPEGITAIADSAFYLKSGVTSVSLPSTLLTIGNSSIRGTSITSINIPVNVTSIGVLAFSIAASVNVTSVTFADNSKLTTIGDYAFQYTDFTTITIPAGVTNIGTGIFDANNDLLSVYFLGPAPTTTNANSLNRGGSNGFVPNVYVTSSNRTGIWADPGVGTTTWLGAAVASPPDAPTSLASTGGNTTASISFTAGNDRDAAISNYKYSFDNVTYTALSPVDATTPIVITGLTNETSYTIYLKAVNAAGDGSASASISVTPFAAPVFTLSSTSQSVAMNSAMTTVTISSTGGTIASYSISPAAPAGLTFSTSTGQLSGSPTSLSSATTYTITGTNSSGSTSQTFILTVTAALVVAVDNSAAVAAAQAEAARKAREQQELIEILALIPKIGELTLSLGETTKSLYSTKCVKGKTTKTVKKGAKCPKGFVKR